MLGVTRRSALAYLIVLGAPGAIAAGLALPAVIEHWTYRTWVATPAVVVDKLVTENPPKGHDEEHPTYTYEFRYRYDAGGTTYETIWMASGHAEGPKRLPPGTRWNVDDAVTVYVDPARPDRSVVNPARATATTHIVVLAGIACILGPLALVLAARR